MQRYRICTSDEFIAAELRRQQNVQMKCGLLAYDSVNTYTYNEAQKIRDAMIKENPFFSRISIYTA